MIKSVNKFHVHELLSPESTVVYRIPPYQREYKWTKQHWDDLYDDLLDAEVGAGHFIGTIICVNQTVDTTHESVLELIDGQQRMTTLSLLLAAIYHCLDERKNELVEDDITDLANLKRQLVLRRPVRARLRPQKQNFNHEDYLNVLKQAGIDVDAPRVRYLGNRRVMKAYKHFLSRIEAQAEETGKGMVETALDMLDRAKQAMLVKLEVESNSDAFVLFESLNNRGLPLTPIDLIKNKLLSTADKNRGFDTESVFAQWNGLLADLGDDYAVQERFFRHYYNAFKSTLPTVRQATVATRTNLIRIYETIIDEDLATFLEGVTAAGAVYKRIAGNLDEDDERTDFDSSLAALSRAQGSTSHLLLLYILLSKDRLGVTEKHLERITQLLASFFVRRNLTGTPQTYGLQSLFMDVIEQISSVDADKVETTIRVALRRVSAPDEVFLEKLKGQIYEENVDVTRFILVSLAEQGFTDETRKDLWAREKNHYKWTIEHILPQGANLPVPWINMLGGDKVHAGEVQQRVVHSLGNLTITVFNSSLSNRSFDYKKDRKDNRGNYIGYRNGLSLNSDVVDKGQWTEREINDRTERLAQRTMSLFPI